MVHPSTPATFLSGTLRALSVCAVIAFCRAPAASAPASATAPLAAEIPAQSLAEALAAFDRQTGLHVVYLSQLVRDQKSLAVPAGLSATEALTRLLQGTGLKFEFLTPTSVRLLPAPPAAAQPPPAAPEEPPAVLPVVLITGSRIPVPANISATGPLQVVTSEDIALGGYVETADAISALTQTVITGSDIGYYSSSSNALGFATADLRGLGPQRTIILINGRRLGAADAHTGNLAPAPDLDQIPLAMIERIEVLSGGASATYGSDAIAGVVNFILKDHVQGLQIEGEYGFAEHTQQNEYMQGQEKAAGITPPRGTGIDGFRRDLSVLAGTSFHEGDGQITGYFVYHSQNGLRGSGRDFTDCSAISRNAFTGVPTQTGFTCLGSPNSNWFVINADSYSVVGSRFVPWPAAGSVPPAYFNSNYYQSAQREDKRYQTGLVAHLRLNEAVQPAFEFGFMDDRTRNYAAPSGLFADENITSDSAAYRVNCSNPLLSIQEATILCTPAEIAADRAHPGSASANLGIGRRNIEGASRVASFEHRNYRAVGSVSGRLDDTWSYNAYALYYLTSLFQANQNYLNYAAINRALQVTTDPSGRPICISGGNCVPYNIFQTGAVTADQLTYLYTQGTDGGHNSEQIGELDVTGQLDRYGLTAPWAREGVAFNAGVEHRTETLSFAPDANELSGHLAGYGGAAVAIDKRDSVDEGFLEVRVPIAQAHPLIHELTIDAGYRYSLYSTAGATSTYKFDLQFEPAAGVRLRAAYDRVIRAPNLIELYTPLFYTELGTVRDPCAPTNGGAVHAAASLEQCARTGVTPAQYGNGFGPRFGGTNKIAQCITSCGAVGGGDATLAPERAKTWSLGVTVNPGAIPTLSASLDYFRVFLEGEIATVPDSVTLQQCLTSGDPTWCSQIVRARNGALSGATVAGGGYILTNLVNTGAALVSGVDLQANYRQALAGGWGTLSGSLSGSWLQHNSSTPYRSGPSYDCAGLFGATCLSGSVDPRWRHNLRVTWETPWNVQLSAQWRFIGRTEFDNNSSQPALHNQEEGFFDPVLTHIPSYSYLDLSAIWTVSRQVQIRVSVSNVLDKDPPFLPEFDISGSAGIINTFPLYDVLGRNIVLALRANF